MRNLCYTTNCDAGEMEWILQRLEKNSSNEKLKFGNDKKTERNMRKCICFRIFWDVRYLVILNLHFDLRDSYIAGWMSGHHLSVEG